MPVSGSQNVAFALPLLLVFTSVAGAASTSSRETVTFDSRLINRTVEGPRCEPACEADGLSTHAGTTGILDAVQTPLTNLPEINLSAFLNTSRAEGSDDFLQVDPKYGFKRFLLVVFIVGGLIRFLTSAYFRKFVCEVLDPLEW
jgi:hypothetical protein